MYNFIESIFTASTPSEARQALMVFINFTVAILLIAGGITIFARNVKSKITNTVLNVTSVLVSFVPAYVVINNLFKLDGELDIPYMYLTYSSALFSVMMKDISILMLVIISIVPVFTNPLFGIKSLSEVIAEWEAEERAEKQAEEEAKRQQEQAKQEAEESKKRIEAQKQAEEEAKRQQEQAEKQAMADLIAESIIKKMKADGLATITLTKESLTESTTK